jgi:lactate/malate dehydrogenase, NAD binding domain
MKLGIVGTGNVGCAIALAAATRGSAREIVLVNRTRKVAEAVATDLRYGIPLGPRIDISDGDYDALNGAGVVLITSGVNEKSGGATDRSDPQGRLRLLQKNAAIYRDIVPKIVNALPKQCWSPSLIRLIRLPTLPAMLPDMIACSVLALFWTVYGFVCISAPTLALIHAMWKRRSLAIMARRRCSCGRPPASPVAP